MVTINNEQKVINGVVRLCSKNSIDEEYVKVAFADHTGLLLLLGSEEVYSSKLLGTAPGITDDMVGQKEVTYDGRLFSLENKDDYQFVKQLYYGGPLDAETECRFSDYASTDESGQTLSLGWMTHNNERADVVCTKIDLKDINI